MLKRKGRPATERDDKNLFDFEKTSTLVQTGIYIYIRHPLYSSLILLTWGILLRNAKPGLIISAGISSICLYHRYIR